MCAGLNGGRVNIASCSLGAAQACLEQTVEYTNTRVQFGQPISRNQALQFRLAEMAAKLHASRQVVRFAARAIDNAAATVGGGEVGVSVAGGQGVASLCAMAKMTATDLCFDVCNGSLQLHGGYGYLKDYKASAVVWCGATWRDVVYAQTSSFFVQIQQYLRDARVHQILEGTNEIMRVIIARDMLGKL
jgi:isobutyryl-CoA dehydrogenase